MRAMVPIIAALLVGFLTGCRAPRSAVTLSDLVPREAAGWRAQGDDRFYDRETIFKYIDGAGEVYLQYDFRRLLVRELARDGAPGIAVQLFDMASPAEAFGIFSFEREDEEAGVGRDSEYAAGLLRFWKGRFFVCVSAEEEGPGVREAVFDLGREIARAIAEDGERPSLLAALPSEGLLARSVRWFHGPFCLAYHYPLPGGNLLALGAETDAVLASYDAGPGSGGGEAAALRARLLIIRYAGPEKAEAALASFAGMYGPPLGADGLVRTSQGRWAGARRTGRFLDAVFEAPTKEAAERLLAETTRRLEGDS